jgi:hypothetical protein
MCGQFFELGTRKRGEILTEFGAVSEDKAEKNTTCGNPAGKKGNTPNIL